MALVLHVHGNCFTFNSPVMGASSRTDPAFLCPAGRSAWKRGARPVSPLAWPDRPHCPTFLRGSTLRHETYETQAFNYDRRAVALGRHS